MDYYSAFASQKQKQTQRQRQQEQQPYDLGPPHLHGAYYGYHQQRSHDAASASTATSYDQYYHHYYYPHEHASPLHLQQRPAVAPALASPGIQLRGGAAVAPGDALDHQGSYPAQPGMNPAAAAAVAALSQLVQLSGDAAERTGAGAQEHCQLGVVDPGARAHVMPPPQLPYEHPMQPGRMRRGAGGRAPKRIGGRSAGHFRGRGTGKKAGFGPRPPRSDGRAPFRGRGRGARIVRSGGGQSHQFASELQAGSAANESITEPASVEAQVPGPAPVLPQQPLPVAWCDICRVGCNSPEILEQHKNGKRHKKTVQKLGEIHAQQKLFTESQAQPCMQEFDDKQTQSQLESQEKVIKPANDVIKEATVNNVLQVGEEIKDSAVSENFQEALTSENIPKAECQVQDIKQSEGAKLGSHDGKNPSKRKAMRFGRGGKRLRTSESVCGKQSRPKEQPRVCTLCSVICETQAVFDSHIAGKKHNSRIRRFQGQSVYGPLNVYIPPNQPSIYDSSQPPPLYFGLQTQDMISLTGFDPKLLFPETYGPYQQQLGGQTIAAPPVETLGLPQDVVDQNAVSASELKKDVITVEVAPGNVGTDTEPAFPSMKDSKTSLESGNAIGVKTCSTTEDGITEAKDAMTTEDAVVKAETALMSGEDNPVPDYGAAAADNVIPGLDVEVQESGKQETSSH